MDLVGLDNPTITPEVMATFRERASLEMFNGIRRDLLGLPPVEMEEMKKILAQPIEDDYEDWDD